MTRSVELEEEQIFMKEKRGLSKTWIFAASLSFFLVGLAVGIGGTYLITKSDDNKKDNCPPVPSFGTQMRQCWFSYLEKDWDFVNHGSYGAPSAGVLESVASFRYRSHENSDLWFRVEMEKVFTETRERLASYIGTEGKSIVLVDDVTEGINAVIRSISLPTGTRVVRTSTAYGMVRNCVDFMIESGKWGDVQLEVVELEWPLSSKEAEAQIIAAVLQDESTTPASLLLIDHISSNPAMVFDVAAIASAAKQANPNIIILVDGAHALGQIPIDLDALARSGVTYYTGNGHKWLVADRGAAFLFAADGYEKVIHPAVISTKYNGLENGWPNEFNWRGTRDYSALPALSAALDVREKVGDKNWREYNNNLCHKASDYFLNERWPESTVPLSDTEFYSLVMVGPIPCNNLQGQACYSYTVDDLKDYLVEQRIWSVIFMEKSSGLFYVRLSCQVYNVFEDYIKLADAIDEFSSKTKSERNSLLLDLI